MALALVLSWHPPILAVQELLGLVQKLQMLRSDWQEWL